MKTSKTMGWVLAVGFASVAVMGSRCDAAEVALNATQMASYRSVQNNAAGITKMAYVTSKSQTSMKYVGGTIFNDDSYHLTFKFYYRDSDNDPQSYTLRFEYNSRGRLVEVTTIDHSSFWEPFNAIKIAGAIIDGVAKELDKR